MKNKTKFAFITLLTFATAVASANSLSGTYKVKTCPAGILQLGTVEQIIANPDSFAQNLDPQGQPGYGSSILLIAAIGDVIQRPTPDEIQLGATLAERQIASYGASGNSFTYRDYLYDMNLTDEQGLAAGPFETVVIQLHGRSLTYDLQYSDGEVYRCELSKE